MNILMACDYKGPNPGNFIPSIRALDQYVQKRGDKVIYAFSEGCESFGWCKQLIKDGATVYFYQSKALRYGVRFLNRIIRKEKINVIHTHFEPFDKPTLLIKLMHPNIKIIWHLHDDFTLGVVRKPTALQRIKMFARDHFVTTIAVSPHIKTKRGHVLINHLAPTYLPEKTKFETTWKKLGGNSLAKLRSCSSDGIRSARALISPAKCFLICRRSCADAVSSAFRSRRAPKTSVL